MHLIRAATLTASDLDRSVEWYSRWLDYELVEDGTLDAQVAESWNANNAAGRRQVTLRPASGRNVFLRFVEQDPHPDYEPLKTYGWNAVEICTQDTDAVNARMEESPFEIIGPPKKIVGLDAIYPMQVMGPDREVVYLTQINEDLPQYDLPRASSLIDSLFILVAGSPDMQAHLDWLETTLLLSPGRTMDINYTMINKAHGLPDGTPHTLATVTHDRDCFLEIDQYPEGSTARPRRDGHLLPGIAAATFHHTEFDAVLELAGATAITPSGFIYGGKRAFTTAAPDGTLYEIVET
ncbi:MAG: hypothetical protein AAF311_06815 [Pseudomonadota bacterium]